MKKVIAFLLLCSLLLAGCGGTQSAEAPVAEDTFTDTTTVSLNMPWDEPAELIVQFNDGGLVSARWGGEDDLDPKECTVTLSNICGNSADIELAWDYGDSHIFTVVNGEVTHITEWGTWEDDYNINWESAANPDTAVYSARNGLWENHYNKDMVLLSTHSEGDYVDHSENRKWHSYYEEYFAEDGSVIKTVNFEQPTDGTWFLDEIVYEDGEIVEKRNESICSYVDNGDTRYRWIKDIIVYEDGEIVEKRNESIRSYVDNGDTRYRWIKDINIDARKIVEGVTVNGEEPMVGNVKHLELALGYTDESMPSDEILSEENAHFFATEDQPVGGWAENVEYYYENSVWSLICDQISGEDWMHGLLDEEPLTVDAAVEFAKESEYSSRFTADYTENGWIRNDSYDNEIINEKLLANSYFEAATYRGYNMHSELDKSTEALEYLERVYEAGGDSSFEIGAIYYDLGNLDQAITWMEEAAKAGHANAAVNAGVFYEKKADTAKAMEWFQKAYEMGASVGALYAGYTYRDRRDFDHSVEWFEKAYEAGNADAACELGDIFHFGTICEVDYEKAFNWYMKAAEMGHATAANNVGAYYLQGYYVEKDTAKANEWFQKAEDMGFTG